MKVKSLPCILLIDDDIEEKMILQEALCALGSSLSLFHIENSRPLSSNSKDYGEPSLILLDINIPGRNGFELLKEIKQNKYVCDIPVVMYSSSTKDEDIALSYALGATSYMRKPRCFDDALQLIRLLERDFDPCMQISA